MKNSSSLAVAFAPDWNKGNPYQALLSMALQAEGISVSYVQPRERGLPLTEAAQGPARLIHLHWPEAFFNTSGRAWRIWARKARYIIDFQKASSRCPFVLTAHNMYPHQRTDEPLVGRLIRMTYVRARAVIAHSAEAAAAVQKEFGLRASKLHVIPHGSWSEDSPPVVQPSIADARARLGIESTAPFCLIYGVIAKYKGIEEAIDFWKTYKPDCDLRVVGLPKSEAYRAALEKQIDGHPRIHLHAKWLTDEEVTTWLWAANCVLFNYVQILTSGAAVQARAFGVPILIPKSLGTVDLSEPHPLVTRFSGFDSYFSSALKAALTLPADYAQAEEFRRHTSWNQVARATAVVYRSVLEG